jgi:single-strand DNA-binding protein
MLRVSLLGNLGAEPESRFSQKGTQIVSFRVAVNQVRFGPDGERQENTEWFRIRVAGRQTEFVQRLGKGTRVLVFGRLDIGHYQGKDGETRTSFDVWADDVQAVSSARPFGPDADVPGSLADADPGEPALAGVSSVGSSAPAGRAGGSTGKNGRAAPGSSGAGGTPEDLEDLPF